MRILALVLCASLCGAATRTISPAGGNYNTTAAWVEGAVPTSSDDVVATASSGNLTISAAAAASAVDLTGYIGTLRHQGAVWTISGGTFTLAATMTYTYTSITTSKIVFAGTSTVNVTCAGKHLARVDFNAHTAQFHTIDPYFADGQTTLIDGTLNTDNQPWRLFTFNSSTNNPDTGPVRTLNTGSSTITIFSGANASWNTYYASNLVLNMGTSLIHFLTLVTPGVRLFGVPAGSTFYDVEFDAGPGDPEFDYVYTDCCSNNATENIHKMTLHGPLRIQVSGNDIWTAQQWVFDTSATRRIVVLSDDQEVDNVCSGGQGVPAIWSSPNNQSADYMDFCESSTAGAGHWYAGAHSTILENPSTGWIFTTPPAWIVP